RLFASDRPCIVEEPPEPCLFVLVPAELLVGRLQRLVVLTQALLKLQTCGFRRPVLLLAGTGLRTKLCESLSVAANALAGLFAGLLQGDNFLCHDGKPCFRGCSKRLELPSRDGFSSEGRHGGQEE